MNIEGPDQPAHPRTPIKELVGRLQIFWILQKISTFRVGLNSGNWLPDVYRIEFYGRLWITYSHNYAWYGSVGQGR